MVIKLYQFFEVMGVIFLEVNILFPDIIQEVGNLRSDNYIDEFVLQLETKSENRKKYCVTILEDFFLIHGKSCRELTNEDCQNYIAYLYRVHHYRNTSDKILTQKIHLIIQYLKYLTNKKIANFEMLLRSVEDLKVLAKKKNTVRKKPIKKAIPIPKIIENFLRYLENHRYHGIEYYKKRIISFHKFLEDQGESIEMFSQCKSNIEKLLFEKIKQYENMIAKRISREELTRSSATVYLRTLQLFVKFLISKNIATKKYIIPIQLRGRAKQANDYVPKEIIIELMDTIYDHSNNVLRDLAIFLIIVDTGCRPIEVTNITMDDFDKVEKTLFLYCGKSDRRKVKISAEVCEVIKDYLTTRHVYNPETNSLFCNVFGKNLSTSLINTIFYYSNIRAFGEAKYPAKAFRHTYITNALDEHSFEKVSKVIGHKEWRSTYYYFEHSKKRLIANTQDFNPLEGIGGQV